MKRQEREVGQSGYEYETLMSLLQVSVSKHLLDENFTLVWANDFYYELIGYSREEYEAIFHNKPNQYYMNEELGVCDEEEWNRIGEKVMDTLSKEGTGYSIVSKMRRKNGSYLWVKMTARFTDEYINGARVAYTVMTDMTDIMDMRVEQSVTYDNLPGFVAKFRVDKNLNLKLLEANDHFYDFFGKSDERNITNPLFCKNTATSMPVFREHKEAIAKGEQFHFTVKMSNRLNEDAWLQINASCIGYEAGEPIYLFIYIDITNETELREMQKKLEIQADQLRIALKEAERANRAKSEFLSRMSHDIRTPLNTVIGMKDIADSHLDDPHKVKDCLKKIGLSGQHLMGLINDVLDMSKIESGEMSLREDVISLPDVLENIVTIMQPQFKTQNQQFSIRLQHVEHEQFLSDALRLRQIFINILSNAYKFTPPGGRISMDVHEISAENGVALFCFRIADTGIGMQPEFLEHLFDAFSREMDSRVDRAEGTGLGMAITKNIVDLLNGEIDVKSAPGNGTEFIITLPLKIEEESASEEQFPNLRILVADDDNIICEHTGEMLSEMGIYAKWVDRGEKAIEQIKEAISAGEMFDAVLLDWKMPGQDGIETTQQIRKLCGEKLPVIIISAYDWSEIEERAEDAGVTGFIQKPIFISTLIHAIQHFVLGKPSMQNGQNAVSKTDLANRRFLLVEDNVLNQEVASELLNDMGASVDIAGDGAQGVEMFRNSKKGFYDMILMDIQMPVMNGYDATRAIRALSHEEAGIIPILAMTADAFAEDVRAAKEAGMNGHLAKLLDKVTLKREISKYLRLD